MDEIFSGVYLRFLSSLFLGNFGMIWSWITDIGNTQLKLSLINKKNVEKDLITLFYSTSQLYTYMYTAPPRHAKRDNHSAKTIKPE